MLPLMSRLYDKKNVRRSLESQSIGKMNSLPFGYSTSLAFARNNVPDTYSEFVKWSNREMIGGGFFDAFGSCEVLYESGNKVAFRSDIERCHDCNNEFVCIYDGVEGSSHAVVVVNHWFARNRYSSFSKYLNSRGMSVIQVPLPYHFERRIDGPLGEQHALSADLGRTLNSFRQAVLDTRKVVKWLHHKGYQKISVVGFCLGGVVAGLVASQETLVEKAVLAVTAGSVADAVWTGETLTLLRERISQHLSLDQLRVAWALINLENYTFQLSRTDLSLMFVLGRYDTVVRPDISQRLIEALERDECEPYVRWLPCGHSSLGMFPWNFVTGVSVANFLEHCD